MQKKGIFTGITLLLLIAIFADEGNSPIQMDEMPVCKPEKGEPFVPIFYYSNVNYLIGVIRKTEKIWEDAKQIEKNINNKGWIEMLDAVVEENDYYYEHCGSLEGNWCRRRTSSYIALDRGLQFKCSPRFKVIGTFQYHSVISKLLDIDCSFYKESDKCREIAGCFWNEEKNPRCISKPPRRPLMSGEDCERIYKETGICPRECNAVVTVSPTGVVEKKCIEAYCEDWRDPASCNDYPDKCEWIETVGNCINAYDCSLYNNAPEQCNRIPVCEAWGNNCYPIHIRWQQFLVYHYNELFKKLSLTEQQNYFNKFICNVAKLNALDLETLTIEYNGKGCGGLPCATGSRYTEYPEPVPDEWDLGHEIGHNSGLGHYWYSEDSYIGGPGNEGKFDTTILHYLIEDLGTKYYGKSKDVFGRPGKFGYIYNIYKRRTTENEEHKLKSIVYSIEECAQKYNKPYRAGAEGVPLKPEEFKKYEEYKDDECKKEVECSEFIRRAISYYKEYLNTLHKGSCHHCVIEECFLGKQSYHFINFMAYNGCPPQGCRFDRYQIYRRGGEGVGGNVLEWLYMSQYPIKYGDEGVYFDIKSREGTYFKIERVKNIFKELAHLAKITDYKIPVFEEGGDNTITVQVFQFVKDGLYDALLQLAGQMCNREVKKINFREIIENSLPAVK